MDSTSSKDTLAYDQLNRLVSINAGAKGRYFYDGEGKRIRKDYAGHKTVYLYDQWGNLIAEVDTTGAFICDYVWASGRLVAKIYVETSIPGPSSIGGAEGMSGPPPELKQYIYYYHLDHLGTPLALTGNNQAIIWTADYLPFGEIYSELIVSPTNEIRFPGQYHDRETGLYYNYFRYYNPRTGRYITPDPIGLEGGINLFAYVDNPITWIDPFGLAGLPFEAILNYVLKNNLSGKSDALLICLIWKESRFDPRAQSDDPYSTARGLMQVTRTALSDKDMKVTTRIQKMVKGKIRTLTVYTPKYSYNDLYDPATNIRAGSEYLKLRIHRAKGDLTRGLEGYGTGRGYAVDILECEKCMKENPCNQKPCLNKIKN